jgi:hypothetical protein
MRKSMLSRYEKVMSDASRMQLQVPYGCCGGFVEAWGIRRVEKRNRGETRSGTGENDNIQGKGRGVECREEGN